MLFNTQVTVAIYNGGNDWLDGRTLVLKPEEFQIHDVASVLRRFIRSLDKPLLTEALRCRWIETASELAFTTCYQHVV